MTVAQLAMGPRERAVFVKSLTGADLAPGADVYVPLDNAVGAPVRMADGRYGHFTGLRARLALTVEANVAMANNMPGSFLASAMRNVRIRAAGTDLYQGGVIDGEDCNQMSAFIYRGQALPSPADVVDGGGLAVATGDIWVSMPLSFTMRDRFEREQDGAIPVGAFDREIDGDHGLRFTFQGASSGAGAASFKGFVGTGLTTITACEIFAVYRTDSKPNATLPGYRIFTQSLQNFDLEPLGGDDGTQELVYILDPPSPTTGVRNHNGYAGISVRFGADQQYTGRSAAQLSDLFNLGDVAYPGPSGWLARLAPTFLPLFSRRADQPVTESAFGRLSVDIETRSTQGERLVQICTRPYNSDASRRVQKSLGGGFTERTPAAATGDAVKNARIAAVATQKLGKGK